MLLCGIDISFIVLKYSARLFNIESIYPLSSLLLLYCKQKLSRMRS